MAVQIPFKIGLAHIKQAVPDLLLGYSGDESIVVEQVASLGDVAGKALMFASKPGINLQEKMNDEVPPSIVLTGVESVIGSGRHLWVRVRNPRLAFSKIALKPQVTPRIHETVLIDPMAIIGARAEIGAFTKIGKCSIGNDAVIGSNVVIEDGCKIGDRVVIKSGAVIGGSGFGFEKDSDGIYHEFYHWGGVRIEDDVRIGANVCIDRGALTDTVIKSGAKIDNLVHIAHNCVVGKNAVLTACAELSGSVTLGDGVWVAPGATVINGVKIGEGAFLGIGSICTQDIAPLHRLTPAFSTIKTPKG